MKTVELDFTTLNFYEDYVISNVKENIVLDKPQVRELLNICQSFYNKKPYVYIADREHKYNVNPIIYINLQKVSTCIGMAMVCKGMEAYKTAEFEKRFSKIPIEIFPDLESATSWAKQLHKI